MYSQTMKSLKFKKVLSDLILAGKKSTTWRLFDDKDLQVGDVVKCVVSETNEAFAKAVLTDVRLTSFKDLQDEDWQGHEPFTSKSDMYKTYSGYYGCVVDESTPVKIVKFELKK
jgi:hypothetical protein